MYTVKSLINSTTDLGYIAYIIYIQISGFLTE